MTTRITVWDRDEFLAAQAAQKEESEIAQLREQILAVEKQIKELEAKLFIEEDRATTSKAR